MDTYLLLVVIMCFSILVYLGLNMYGLILFIQKMYALTKLKTSTRNHVDKKKFTDKEKKLLRTTTKYVSLLSLAYISTLIAFTVVSTEALLTDSTTFISGSMLTIDCVINIICLYLQFPFSKEYYDKYCQCFDNCCTYFVAMNL